MFRLVVVCTWDHDFQKFAANLNKSTTGPYRDPFQINGIRGFDNTM
jgi:hypothetical protein